MEFGEFLAKLRKERGILQKELAAYLNMTVATVSNYEANISTLNTQLSPEYTLSDLMNTTLELDRHNTDALLDYYELLTMRNAIKHPK